MFCIKPGSDICVKKVTLKEHLSGLPLVRRGFADTNGNGQSQNQLAARNHLLTPPKFLHITTVLLFLQFKQNLRFISKFQINNHSEIIWI